MDLLLNSSVVVAASINTKVMLLQPLSNTVTTAVALQSLLVKKNLTIRAGTPVIKDHKTTISSTRTVQEEVTLGIMTRKGTTIFQRANITSRKNHLRDILNTDTTNQPSLLKITISFIKREKRMCGSRASLLLKMNSKKTIS